MLSASATLVTSHQPVPHTAATTNSISINTTNTNTNSINSTDLPLFGGHERVDSVMFFHTQRSTDDQSQQQPRRPHQQPHQAKARRQPQPEQQHRHLSQPHQSASGDGPAIPPAQARMNSPFARGAASEEEERDAAAHRPFLSIYDRNDPVHGVPPKLANTGDALYLSYYQTLQNDQLVFVRMYKAPEGLLYLSYDGWLPMSVCDGKVVDPFFALFPDEEAWLQLCWPASTWAVGLGEEDA